MTFQTIISSLGLTALLGISSAAQADHSYEHLGPKVSNPNTLVSTFYTYESNDLDYIAGIGTSITFIDPRSKFGFGLTTSLTSAEVLATDGYIEEYNAWEGSIRAGYFSDVFAYMEVGIDLTELIFHDIRNDEPDYFEDPYYYDDYHRHDDVDSFIGVGAGVNFGILKVEGFSRLREIDSPYWEADATWFSGVKVSINF